MLLESEDFESQYLQLLNYIITKGSIVNTRNAITKSVKDVSFKIDLSVGFPILTVRKVFWRGIVEELLWMLKGSTDVKELQNKNIHIWDGNSSREYLDKYGFNCYPEGYIGPGYGYQFRHKNVDQWLEVIKLIKNDPTSRRIIINLWDVDNIKNMALPPCHILYQFSVTEGKLNCHLYQRSWDIMCGWNTSTAALITHILANFTGLNVGTLTHTISDVHIYEKHIEQVKEILNRTPLSLPKLIIKNKRDKVEDFIFEDFIFEDYQSHPSIKLEMIA
jgi:thymidylate synthase